MKKNKPIKNCYTFCKWMVLLLILISLLSNFISCSMLTEGYHFFDNFYYSDIYELYLKQKSSKKCLISDGPNCLYIKGKNISEMIEEMKNIYHTNITGNETIEEISNKLKISVENTKELGSQKLDTPFSLNSPVLLTLLLSFESYDEKTRIGDIYSPDSIDTPFDFGRVTLSVFGKLRLTQKNSKEFESNDIDKEERPRGTYAVVDSKEVIIKFNGVSTLVSVYIKRNEYNTDNKMFVLYGYKNEVKFQLSTVKNVPKDSWYKVNIYKQISVDCIVIPRGFDYDNFMIIHYSKDEELNAQYSKKYSSIMSDKINAAVSNVLKKIDSKKDKNQKIVKVVEINLNADDLINEEQTNDFEIPDDLVEELGLSFYIEEKKEHDKQKEEKTFHIEQIDEDL